MRNLRFFLIASVITLFFVSCGSKQIVYNFKENKFVYESDSLPYGQKKILAESSAYFLTYEFKGGKEPMKIHVNFNGLLPKISTINRITIELSQKNEKGETITIQPKELKEFQAEYSNGRTIIQTPLKNDNISSQVNWKEADWGEYTKNANVNLVGTFVFDLQECTDQIFMKFVIKWKDSEKSFETTLTKADYVGPKFNPKY